MLGFFFLICNIITVIILCLPLQFSKHILEFNYFQGEEGQLFHYYQMLFQSVCTKCRLQIADCTQAVLDCRSSIATDSYFCTHDENQTKLF